MIPSYLKIEILAKRSYLVTLGNKKLIFLSKKVNETWVPNSVDFVKRFFSLFVFFFAIFFLYIDISKVSNFFFSFIFFSFNYLNNNFRYKNNRIHFFKISVNVDLSEEKRRFQTKNILGC